MDLFTQISGYLSENYSITINIEKLPREKQEMKVNVLAKINTKLVEEDECYLSPIILQGDASKLDETFFDIIKVSLIKLNDTSISIFKLEKDLEELLKKAVKKTEVKELKTKKEDSKPKMRTDSDVYPEKELKIEESKLAPSEKRTLMRVELLVKSGFKYNSEKDSYIKGEAYISSREIKLLAKEGWDKFLKLAIPKKEEPNKENKIEEQKIEKPDNAENVTAFDGNASKTGTKNVPKTKDDKLTKSSDTPKDKFFDDEGNITEDNKSDDNEIQENKDFDKQEEKKTISKNTYF